MNVRIQHVAQKVITLHVLLEIYAAGTKTTCIVYLKLVCK